MNKGLNKFKIIDIKACNFFNFNIKIKINFINNLLNFVLFNFDIYFKIFYEYKKQ